MFRWINVEKIIAAEAAPAAIVLQFFAESPNDNLHIGRSGFSRDDYHSLYTFNHRSNSVSSTGELWSQTGFLDILCGEFCAPAGAFGF